MNIGYVFFALGVIGLMVWAGGMSANAGPADRLAPSHAACVQTVIGDIASCD